MQGNTNSRISNIFARRIWNPKSWALKSVIHLEESEIPLTIEIRNPSSTDQKKKIQTPVPGILSWIPLRRANVTSTFYSAHSTALLAVNCHVSRISSAFTSPRPRCTHDMAIFAAAATCKCKHDSCYVSARAARKLKREQRKRIERGGIDKEESFPFSSPRFPNPIISPSL